jgi:hypothetical protein
LLRIDLKSGDQNGTAFFIDGNHVEIAVALNSSLPPFEMVRLSNAASRMMQIYQEALLTLQKIRTGGKQTVVVQHVEVSEGGQAVIAGSMKSGEGA